MAPAAILDYGSLLLLGVAIFNSVTGSENTTAGSETMRISCNNINRNCTDGTIGLRWSGHFSKCPEEYQYYCIKGRCHYVVVAQTPACICEPGYMGARCERLDLFYLRGDHGQIVVVSVIAGMVMLIILIACICICTRHCRKKCRKKKQEEMGIYSKGQLIIKTDDILETDTV